MSDRCQCDACKLVPHRSDCAVHNAPAYFLGLCSCGAEVAFLKAQIAAKDKRLKEAEWLMQDWLINEYGHIIQDNRLQEKTKSFLTTPTNPDMVMVRRDYAEQILAVLEEGTIEYDRLKALLREGIALLDKAVRGGDASPGAWVQLVCEIADYLSRPYLAELKEEK